MSSPPSFVRQQERRLLINIDSLGTICQGLVRDILSSQQRSLHLPMRTTDACGAGGWGGGGDRDMEDNKQVHDIEKKFA